MLAPSPSIPTPSHTRAIALLAVAGFASQAQVRAADSVLPQIAADLGVTVGAASVVVSSYLIVHGTMQLFIGPFADRFGKYQMIAVNAALSALCVFACGLTQSLSGLTLARVAAGATASWIIPLGLAYIGDVVPYERRQQVLGRYLTGQISGQLFGQAAGGIIGDALGWRAVFLVLGGIFALAAVALFAELRINPLTRPLPRLQAKAGFFADYTIVLANPWARVVMLAVFLEGAFMFGPFAFVGADLRLRFDLNYTLIGIVIGMFGIGGLIYAGVGEATGGLVRPDRPLDRRRARARPRLSDPGAGTGMVDHAAGGGADRSRLLHAAQYAADECDPDGAGGTRDRGGAVLGRALYGPAFGRRGGRPADRPHRCGAGVSDGRGPAADARLVVRALPARAGTGWSMIPKIRETES